MGLENKHETIEPDWSMPFDVQERLESEYVDQGQQLPQRIGRPDQHPGQLNILVEAKRLALVSSFAVQQLLA